MDHESFDYITRSLTTAGTRRAALGAIFGATALGAGIAEAKNKTRRRGVGADAQAPCQNPGPGKNLSKCDLSGADLRGRNLRGANLSQANLSGADLCSADLRGANLSKTDFTGANLTRVDFRGTNLSTAIMTNARLCQTRKPNGKLDHAHCPPQGTDVCCGDDECEGVCQRGQCLQATCHSLGQICHRIPDGPCGNCCGSNPPVCSNDVVFCAPELDLVTTRCRYTCDSDADCTPFGDFECVSSLTHCVFGKCCRPKTCADNTGCISHLCCHGQCCLATQQCNDNPLGDPCLDT